MATKSSPLEWTTWTHYLIPLSQQEHWSNISKLCSQQARWQSFNMRKQTNGYGRTYTILTSLTRSKMTSQLMIQRRLGWYDIKTIMVWCFNQLKTFESTPTTKRRQNKKEKTQLQIGHLRSFHSKAHWFSRRTSSSSSGVKSFLMLNVLRISSGVFPLIMSATVWQVKSSKLLMFR